MSQGHVHQINRSRGGVPKTSVDECDVTSGGIVGDGHDKPDIHGGPTRAVSLFSKQRIDALAAEGHPIAPGSTGENLTLTGLDWGLLRPGTRLRVGDAVELLITSYADPCRTIAGSFSDGRFNRLNQRKTPGSSRLYAEVRSEGRVRVGDPVRVEGTEVLRASAPANENRSATDAKEGSMLQLGYVNLYVGDLERSLTFFRDALGLAVQYSDAGFGYASLDAGPLRMGLAQVDMNDAEQRALVGRQTGIGFVVTDLAATHQKLAAAGVAFPMEPAKQPWGAVMAMFEDPDGNVFYLDEAPPS